jgi:hypothetical protein
MELDSAWHSVDEGERVTYTNALGEEESEVLAPIPPPSSLQEDGFGTIAGSGRLDMHTGAQQWARKGMEVPKDDFDDDLARPTVHLNTQARMRANSAVGRNRTATAFAADREEFTGRDSLYDGMNVRLAREPKNKVPTNRETQNWLVTGATHSVIQAAKTSTRNEEALKNGPVEGGIDHGRLSAVTRVASAPSTHLGGEGMFERAALAGGAAFGAIRRRENAAVSLRPEGPSGLQTRRSSTFAAAASTAEAALGSRNDIRSRVHGANAGTTLAAPAGAGILGGDCTLAAKPIPRTFAESAALAADRYIGGDSQATRAARVLQHEVTGGRVNGQVRRTLRHDPHTAPVRAETTEVRQAIDAKRARDGRTEALRPTRAVRDALDTPAAVAEATRTGRAVHALDTTTRSGANAIFPAASGEITAVRKNAFNTYTQTRIERGDVVAAIRSAVGRILGRFDHTTVLQGGVQKVVVSAPVPPQERNFSNDEFAASHPPLSSGTHRNALGAETEHMIDRTANFSELRRQSANQPIRVGEYERRGHRD